MGNSNFTIYKADDDKRLVFGWASVAITVDGSELEDRQHDMIDPEDLEDAAYEYVLNFRDTGEEHLPGYRKKGKLIESCVLTKEKQKAMGIPEGILPVAWWIGFKIEDDETWRKVKNGTYKMFSIEGKAQRIPVEKARKNYDEFPSYDMWLEENLDATIDEQKAAKAWYKVKKAKPTVCAVLIKLVALPALFLPLAVALGFRDAQLMAILIMLGSPSTPSGYIMAKQMGNDDVLANGIIVLTTLLAAVTITLWIFLLRSFGLL